MTGRVGSALPCACGPELAAPPGPSGGCAGAAPTRAPDLNLNGVTWALPCPCDSYGLTLDAPELDGAAS